MPAGSSKRVHRLGLARIAVACCLVILGGLYLPIVFINLSNAEGTPNFLRGLLQSSHWLLYRNIDGRLNDLMQVYGRGATLDPRIVFLAIDSHSSDLQDLFSDEKEELLRKSRTLEMMSHGLPWDRRVYGDVIQRLVDVGAKVVTFDILFPAERDVDPEFRQVLDKYARSVVIGGNLQLVDEGNGQVPFFAPPSPSLIDDPTGADDRVGFVNFKPDLDNRVRRAIYRTSLTEYFHGFTTERGNDLYSLSARTAMKAGFGEAVPKDADGVMFRFLKREQVRPFSLHDIFIPRHWENTFRGGEFFKDKMVFIGPFANYEKDQRDVLDTPFGQTLGPQIHLSALNAILTGDFLTEPPVWLEVTLILLGAAAALVAGSLIAGPLERTVALVVISGIYVAIAFLVYNNSGVLLSLLSPTSALLSSGFVGLVWERVLEQREKNRVRKTLERYVSKDVVQEVLDNPQSFLNLLGGQRRKITVLFSDVRGFTSLTESADAVKLVIQLNEYFTEMVRIVFAHRGTLDKFIGDAVMAQWGGVTSRGDVADGCRGVAAALDMIKALHKLNVRWKERGMTELHIGIGVNHGEAICGNMGSDEKQEFTAIGDPVNLASRLEGATKEFHQDILIGEQLAPLLRDHYILRTVDYLQVKGKTQSVEVYTIVGTKNNPAPEWLEPYEEGVRLYRQREFAAALKSFEAATEFVAGDWLLTEYQRRCREFVEAPPDEDWEITYTMATK